MKYIKDLSDGFAFKWDELIDWDTRWKIDSQNLRKIIEEFAKDKRGMIIDLATGTGVDLIYLIKSGYNVAGVDGSPDMLKVAKSNLKKFDLAEVEIQLWDWTNSENLPFKEKTSLSFCMGNSFACLLSQSDREKSLKNFYDMLSDGGVLILDHRNYETIVNSDTSLLGAARYYGSECQISKNLCKPGLAIFDYKFEEGTYSLTMSPVFIDELLAGAKLAGFELVRTIEEKDVFYTHIFKKV
jgi:SAM-dependent methyltransferase